jgi:hypothetical protein
MAAAGETKRKLEDAEDSQPQRRRLDDADDTGGEGSSNVQMQRMVMRLNAIASETKMKLREAIQRSAKFDAAALSVVVTEYAYEARPCIEHLKPVLDQFSRVPWYMAGIVQELWSDKAPEWVGTMCSEYGSLRFCRFYNDKSPVAFRLVFHKIGADHHFQVEFYKKQTIGAYAYGMDSRNKAFTPSYADNYILSQNELVADFV